MCVCVRVCMRARACVCVCVCVCVRVKKPSSRANCSWQVEMYVVYMNVYMHVHVICNMKFSQPSHLAQFSLGMCDSADSLRMSPASFFIIYDWVY